MCRVDDAGTFRHLIQLIHEDGTLLGQIVHDIAVMNDLFANVDRCAECLKRNANDIDCSHNSGAETAGFEKEDAFGEGGGGAAGRHNSIV